MRKLSTRSIAMAALALAGLTLVSSNIYMASGESSQINGCVNKKTQVLRIAEKCATSETKISWSKSSATTELAFHQVLDATGKVVGNLIGSTIDETVVLIGKSKVPYSDSTGEAVSRGKAIYLKPDCTGPPYELTNDTPNRWTIENPFIVSSIPQLGLEGFAAFSVAKPIKKYTSQTFSYWTYDSGTVCEDLEDDEYGDRLDEIQQLKIIEGIPMKVPVPFTIK
jgi:hypothetical protein